MAKKPKTDDVGIVVATKEEAMWVEIRTDVKESIVRLNKQRMFQEAVLELSNEKLKEYDKKKTSGYIA